MNVEEIREKIEKNIPNVLSENSTIRIRDDAYGHSAGDSIEEFIKKMLINQGLEAYYTNEFIEKFFNLVGRDERKLESILEDLWWNDLPLYSRKQKTNFLNGKKIGGYQQAGADIVIFYGDDILKEPEKLILINAKSHNVDRKSRAPNIISAQRLLEFCNKILSTPEKLNYTEYWFMGVNHTSIDASTAKIKSIMIKDLFKINTDKITQINFDAAIQIQTHISDMEEISQTKKEFIKNLSDLFIKTWHRHTNQKTKKYESLVEEINSKI